MGNYRRTCSERPAAGDAGAGNGGGNVAILAAGGITTGADVVAMLSLDAQGVVLGTALIATYEAFAHTYHKQRLVEARAGDTVLTDSFHINWPRGARVRVLANNVTRGERGDPLSSMRTVIGEEQAKLPSYLMATALDRNNALRQIRIRIKGWPEQVD